MAINWQFHGVTINAHQHPREWFTLGSIPKTRRIAKIVFVPSNWETWHRWIRGWVYFKFEYVFETEALDTPAERFWVDETPVTFEIPFPTEYDVVGFLSREAQIMLLPSRYYAAYNAVTSSCAIFSA